MKSWKWYKNKPESESIQILKELKEHTISKEKFEEIIKDISDHLDTPVGTLDNYNGEYKFALKTLQEEYNYFIPNEEIIGQKVSSFMKMLSDRFIKNQTVNVPQQYFKLIMDYLQNNNVDTTQAETQFVVVGYPEATKGDKMLPAKNNL